MFITDRDLALFEPGLGRDVAWGGQTLARGACTIASRIATMPGMRAFDAGIAPGMLLVIGASTLEITGVDSEDSVSVSSIRPSAADPIRIPPDAGPLTASVVTFTPQILSVHRQILAMLGVADLPTSALPPGETRLGVDRILNPGDLSLLEALGALHLIYAGAEALLGGDSAAAQKARAYRDRFAHERWRAAALIDTDGDGVADATRRLNVSVLVRG